MKKKTNTPLAPSKKYDPERDLLVKLGVASMLAEANMEVLGEPGGGKTTILHWLGLAMGGGHLDDGGGYLKVECHAATRPSELVGHENPLWSLTPNANALGIPYWQYMMTPRDPRTRLVLLNELQRAPDQAKGSLLAIMDNGLSDHNRIVFWADGNFLTVNPVLNALIDRFPIRVWLPSTTPDPAVVKHSGLPQNWQWSVPDYDTILQVRKQTDEFWQDGEGSKADDAVIASMGNLIEATANTSFRMTKRRQTVLMRIMYSHTFFVTGEADFSQLSRETWDVISYAYPTQNPLEAIQWRGIVMSCIDVVASAIAEYEANARRAMMDATEAIKTEYRLKSVEEKRALVREKVAHLLEGYLSELQDRPDADDLRVQQCIHNLENAFIEMYRGI